VDAVLPQNAFRTFIPGDFDEHPLEAEHPSENPHLEVHTLAGFLWVVLFLEDFSEGARAEAALFEAALFLVLWE